MSDDEELMYTKRARTIHYGSLEESERMRQEHTDSPDFRMDTGSNNQPSDYFNLDEEV